VAKVSTIIAVYNDEATIAQAIDSALAQDYDDHEVIVVNDGSTDSTGTILKEYGNRIHVVSQSNAGQSMARNTGVRYSTSKYIAFLDADDTWLPHKLKAMVAELERNPFATLAFSESRYIDNQGVNCGESFLGHAPSMDELLIPRPFPILPSTWVLTRQVFESVGGFSEAFGRAQGFEDTWMLFLFRELGEFVYLPECLTIYRVQGYIAGDRYAPGLLVFVSLLKERYGRKGRRWARYAKHSQCRDLLSKIAHQMNDRNRLGALRTVALIFRLWPTYFIGRQFLRRLLAPQNARRLREMISILPRPHNH
jgi:glycosyltransferase involved in cell wall biosynthesis